MSRQSFIASYIEAALWSSHDDEGAPLDDGAYELAPETHAIMEREAGAFYDAHNSKFQYEYITRNSGDVDGSAGHDFWLTRCGHGAGFWDGDWKEPIATELTDASKAAGNCDLYIGDDGLIYQA